MFKRMMKMLLVAAPLLFLLGCQEYGKVDQGRVVAYDKDKKVVTLIRDKANDQLNPDYSYLPALVYSMPSDPNETGPEPKAGLRMKLDLAKNDVCLYDPAAQNFQHIAITVVDKQEGVGRDHPLVFDKEQGKAKKFPAVDKEKKTVTIYSGRQKILATFSVPEEYMALPEAAWDSGDEVRIYYHAEGKATRFMNISRTDIFKK